MTLSVSTGIKDPKDDLNKMMLGKNATGTLFLTKECNGRHSI